MAIFATPLANKLESESSSSAGRRFGCRGPPATAEHEPGLTAERAPFLPRQSGECPVEHLVLNGLAGTAQVGQSAGDLVAELVGRPDESRNRPPSQPCTSSTNACCAGSRSPTDSTNTRTGRRVRTACATPRAWRTPRSVAGLRSTREVYEKDWREFGSFCRAHRLCDDPVDATALAVGEYVNEMVRDRKAYSTISRRIAAISFCQRLATGSTATYDPLVVTALQGARRLLSGRGVTQAMPLRLVEMRSIVTSLPIVAERRAAMRRDQLVIGLGWASALRASELVGLDVEDLTFVGDSNTGVGGLLVRVRNGKGADRVEWVAVPFASHIHTCPVRRTMRYTASLRSGPLFRHIDRHGRQPRLVGARPVTDIVRRVVTNTLQIDAAGYTSHSMRAGFVTMPRALYSPQAV